MYLLIAKPLTMYYAHLGLKKRLTSSYKLFSASSWSLFPPKIHAHVNNAWAMWYTAVDYATETNRQVRYDRVAFSASKFANSACLQAVKPDRSICAYLWAGHESKNFV